MSIVSVSLNTETRAVALAIDGQLVAATEVSLSQYTDCDGVQETYFRYATKAKGPNGLDEVHCFVLPPKPDDQGMGSQAEKVLSEPNAHGLVEVAEFDQTKVQADIAKFLNRKRGT